jgi:uncharacterized protein (UPF0335 family)
MTDPVTANELAQFIERIEAIEGDIREYNETKKEVYAEAKGRGYSAPIIREIVKLRRMNPNDRAEREAILDLYRNALGMD